MLSSKRALQLFLFSLALLAMFSAACAGGKPIDVGPPGGDDDDDDAFDGTFSGGAYLALAQEDCGSATCHSNANQLSTGNLELPGITMTITTGAAFTEIVTENAAVNGTENSPLLQKGLGVGHGGLQQWDDNDATYEAVLEWVLAGGQNN